MAGARRLPAPAWCNSTLFTVLVEVSQRMQHYVPHAFSSSHPPEALLRTNHKGPCYSLARPMCCHAIASPTAVCGLSAGGTYREGGLSAAEPNELEDNFPLDCAGANFTQTYGSPKAWGWADTNCNSSRIFMCRKASELPTSSPAAACLAAAQGWSCSCCISQTSHLLPRMVHSSCSTCASAATPAAHMPVPCHARRHKAATDSPHPTCHATHRSQQHRQLQLPQRQVLHLQRQPYELRGGRGVLPDPERPPGQLHHPGGPGQRGGLHDRPGRAAARLPHHVLDRTQRVYMAQLQVGAGRA
jgi:hypothetical protein